METGLLFSSNQRLQADGGSGDLSTRHCNAYRSSSLRVAQASRPRWSNWSWACPESRSKVAPRMASR